MSPRLKTRSDFVSGVFYGATLAAFVTLAAVMLLLGLGLGAVRNVQAGHQAELEAVRAQFSGYRAHTHDNKIVLTEAAPISIGGKLQSVVLYVCKPPRGSDPVTLPVEDKNQEGSNGGIVSQDLP